MREPLIEDVVISPRYMRKPLHFLAIIESFSRFQLQDKHNALFVQKVSVFRNENTVQRYNF